MPLLPSAQRLGPDLTIRKVLLAVVEAQLDDDQGVDAASPELLKGSSPASSRLRHGSSSPD